MAKAVWYTVPDILDDEKIKLSLVGEVDITRPIEQEDIAEQCGEHFYQHHDGWECAWPLDFALYATEESCDPLAIFTVEFEAVPMFRGRPKEKNMDAAQQ